MSWRTRASPDRVAFVLPVVPTRDAWIAQMKVEGDP